MHASLIATAGFACHKAPTDVAGPLQFDIPATLGKGQTCCCWGAGIDSHLSQQHQQLHVYSSQASPAAVRICRCAPCERAGHAQSAGPWGS